MLHNVLFMSEYLLLYLMMRKCLHRGAILTNVDMILIAYPKNFPVNIKSSSQIDAHVQYNYRTVQLISEILIIGVVFNTLTGGNHAVLIFPSQVFDKIVSEAWLEDGRPGFECRLCCKLGDIPKNILTMEQTRK